MAWEILQGDVRERLQDIPEKSIQCVVTSPPYYGLRDYGTDGQIGLEKTPDEYVQSMVEVLRGVKRGLRDDGVVWLNLGDSYAGSNQGAGTKAISKKQASNKGTNYMTTEGHKSLLVKIHGLKPKDLIGIPWRVAFALQADGWYLRSDIIWHKPNPMPESVTDRPTKAHEYIFLLTKNQKYFYDAEAIKEPVAESTIGRGKVDFGGKKGREYNPDKNDPNYRAGSEQWGRTFDYTESCKNGRNKRSVWTVATQPYPGSHFAVFPPKLIEPCILAGSSERACEVCGSPWERAREKTGHINKREPAHAPNNCPTKTDSTGWAPTSKAINRWQPTCSCDNEGKAKCKVLDPFAGSGTTLWVAESHGRDSKGIELNSEYVKLIEKRMSNFQQTIFSFAP